jgi:hypothetical protein
MCEVLSSNQGINISGIEPRCPVWESSTSKEKTKQKPKTKPFLL